ncbi:hypothetical protein GPY51_10970 [Photorhabdus laumondii subsp. laumondii]|uniref:Photorhabdus luminescens subsp. laumondii TTO1 complete genome segment 10/17 n=2 Tax=Photorhabdus laumondii subsp. laumondii TaxID=141679 RepID=Q7N310_PHOLL|nr:hypothetical protein [Photorhabdus laumondii]AWK42621.1 hypothetical protein A4R40_14535 [Photorhabdus laumondii subsp. laumondii]AXG47946.1 hypothetical protein PluTT01m_14955 [Photorhabdus laumondii subsp. laumondii]MCC8384602.1 hypothetical protein [Photorhabdus laumondii]MCC8413352.1 hypothetical protein [Photorhabdus laumondii]NDK95017.1 hypothetical protein [Photorhabdus laumondii subsp. laumondii]
MNDWILYFYAFAGVVATFVCGLIWLSASARLFYLYALWQLKQGKRALRLGREMKREAKQLIESNFLAAAAAFEKKRKE